jgi:intein-encoded DNA endonuclease-like protein
LKILGDV